MLGLGASTGKASVCKTPTHTNNYSLAFDGTDDFVELNQVFNYTTFSISVWLKIPDSSGTRVFFDGRDSGGDGTTLYTSGSSDKVIISINGQALTQTTAIRDAWQHIGVSYDGSTIKLYSNAVTVQTKSTTQTVAVTETGRLGAKAFGLGDPIPVALQFAGRMDEFAFFSSVLTGAEFVEIYEAVNTDGLVLDLTKDSGDYASSSDLLDYYRFEGPGTSATNKGSRGVAGTVSSATYDAADYPGA
jgi:hypothetical protein